MIDHSFQQQLREQYNPEGSTLRNIQHSLLRILLEIDRICSANGIPYWLDSGTLIGAQRHGGFIPWDDDLDICILRKDYRRFCRVMRRELQAPYKLFALGSTDGYSHPWPRIIDDSISLERTLPDGTFREEPLWVDIFLMCNGSPSLARKIDKIYGRCFRRRYRLICDGRWKHAVAVVAYPFAYALAAVSRFAGRFVCPETYLHDFATGFYSVRKRAHIFPLKTILFEGQSFPAPNDVDNYLRLIYGDYTRIPEEEKRITHHIASIKYHDNE